MEKIPSGVMRPVCARGKAPWVGALPLYEVLCIFYLFILLFHFTIEHGVQLEMENGYGHLFSSMNSIIMFIICIETLIKEKTMHMKENVTERTYVLLKNSNKPQFWQPFEIRRKRRNIFKKIIG